MIDAEDRGLDAAGHIRRDGSLERVPAAFAPAVAGFRRGARGAFGPRLHSAYLYGSVPRGTATPGLSDLDAVVLLRDPPGPADRQALAVLAAELDSQHLAIDGAGLLLFSAERIIAPAERYDLGFFLACQCTPLTGEDIAAQLPSYRPTARIARDTNGDIGAFLDLMRERLASAESGPATARLCRVTGRKLVRTAFTLVMPRWGGWRSDLAGMAEIFARHYPDRAAEMAVALRRGLDPRPEPAATAGLIDGLGQWLAAEYARVIGVKPDVDGKVAGG